MRYYLALIQRPERLTAVILRASLAPPRFVALFERETGAGEMSESVLQALKSDCDAAGYGAAWSNGAVVCLSAENAIFHDFMLPPKIPVTKQRYDSSHTYAADYDVIYRISNRKSR